MSTTNQKSAREIAEDIINDEDFAYFKDVEFLARAYLELEKKNTKVTKILNWLVFHAIDTASISKAKGAELLGISLIDMDNYRNSLDMK